MCQAIKDWIAEERAAGMAEGREAGRLKGREDERGRVNRLTQLLAEQNRIDDIIKAASDKEYQEKLLKEFQL